MKAKQAEADQALENITNRMADANVRKNEVNELEKSLQVETEELNHFLRHLEGNDSLIGRKLNLLGTKLSRPVPKLKVMSEKLRWRQNSQIFSRLWMKLKELWERSPRTL